MDIKNLKPSETVLINSMVLQRRHEGKPVFSLGAGEPVLDTPRAIKQAANAALRQNKTLYPPVAGIPELRTLAAAWMNKSYGAEFKADNILVTNGGKLGLYLIFQALLKVGDEVLLPVPYWVSYPSIVKLFGGRVKTIKTSIDNNWKITPEQLRRACGKASRILILNSANNPTGALYDKQELREILAVAQQKNLTVISDEVYSGLVYDGNKFFSCAAFREFRKNVIVIQSCSKNFAMTGWRVGFVMADVPLIKILTNLLSQSTSGVTTISQWAAVAALKNPQKFTAPIRLELQKRRDALLAALSHDFRRVFARPQSSLYLFLAMRELGIKNISSTEFCLKLLQRSGVALIPGSACGQEGYVRLSFGSKQEVIRQAVKVLFRYCKTGK